MNARIELNIFKTVAAIILISFSLTNHAFSQMEFSGTWVLKNRKSIEGPNYENGVPLKISISLLSDSIIIERKSLNENNEETVVSEKLKINDREVESRTTLNNKKLSKIAYIKDNQLEEYLRYTSGDNVPVKTTVYKIHFSLDGLQLVRMDYDTLNRITLAMQGIYEIMNGNNGLKFESNLSWEEIKSKASKEGKLIFLDCYTTWCGPCKKMDLQVYSLESIGTYLNKNYVSVKVQLDTSLKDSEQVKKWYKEAARIQKEYDVNAFPTYLFFTKDGEILHRANAYKTPNEFLALAMEAKDTAKQFYRLLKNFRVGNRDYETTQYLVRCATTFDQGLADEIAKDYIASYIKSISQDTALLKKENVEFILSFAHVLSSRTNAFRFFFSNSSAVDRLIGKNDFTFQTLSAVISKEEAVPLLQEAKENHTTPKWQEIIRHISNKYNYKYAISIVTDLKVEWFKEHEMWDSYIGSLIAKVKLRDISNVDNSTLNNYAWEIFQHSHDNKQLNEALKWSEYSILSSTNNDQLKANHMDTKANILYKLNRKKEAMLLEDSIIKMVPDFKSAKSNLEKMKANKPTWDF
jgi:thiol-disulfide isomerase/thioredoxin